MSDHTLVLFDVFEDWNEESVVMPNSIRIPSDRHGTC